MRPMLLSGRHGKNGNGFLDSAIGLKRLEIGGAAISPKTGSRCCGGRHGGFQERCSMTWRCWRLACTAPILPKATSGRCKKPFKQFGIARAPLAW